MKYDTHYVIIFYAFSRYLEATGTDIIEKGTPLEIHIATDDNKKTFTIQVRSYIKLDVCIQSWFTTVTIAWCDKHSGYFPYFIHVVISRLLSMFNLCHKSVRPCQQTLYIAVTIT